MSFKKLTVAILVGVVTCSMLGCSIRPQKNTQTASSDFTDSSEGIQNVASFSGEVMSPEQESALLNQTVVHFAYDDSNLSSSDERVLNVHAKHMLENPNLAMKIKGHTDERGSREYNIALGERRANSVGRYLETKGVPSNRISTVSYGKEQPVNLESNDAAWAQNRRAELEYSEG